MEGIPPEYKDLGQPVIIGGSMETGSYLLLGTSEGGQTFFSTAHGSGRTLSRSKAKKMFQGKQILKQMEKRGIIIRSASLSSLAEEAGPAYKDIDEVVDTVVRAGINSRVVRFLPIGNIKG